MKIVAVIPARYESTRLPGKVLLKNTGKFLVEHTYEAVKCAGKIDDIIIAADDVKILEACRSFGAKAVLTSKEHQSGTDRIAEAVEDIDADIIVNVQADEPEIDPANIDLLAELMIDNDAASMATLIAGFENADDVANSDIVKCITDVDGYAIYFSRLPLPYSRDCKGVGELGNYARHLGIYAYRKDFLLKFTAMEQSLLEKSEKLEQLRAIENGYKILTAKVERTCDGIDTLGQYEAFVDRCSDVRKK